MACVPSRGASFYLGSSVSWAFHGRSRPAKARHGFEHPVEGAGHVVLVVLPDDRFGDAAIVAHVAGGDASAEHPSDRRMPQRVRADMRQLGGGTDALECLAD